MFRILRAGLPRFFLVLLALIPVLIGAAILTSMHQGTLNAFTHEADIIRRASYPWAVIGHIIGGSAMLMLGLLQFSARLRRRFPAWHRWSGRALVAAGAYFALSGLWMNASPHAQPDSWLHDAAQDIVAPVFLTVLALGVVAIRRGDVAGHRAWMLRVYAITLGTATQTALLLPMVLLFGPPVGLKVDLAFISGLLINLVVAEWIIRRNRSPRRRQQAIAA